MLKCLAGSVAGSQQKDIKMNSSVITAITDHILPRVKLDRISQISFDNLFSGGRNICYWHLQTSMRGTRVPRDALFAH